MIYKLCGSICKTKYTQDHWRFAHMAVRAPLQSYCKICRGFNNCRLLKSVGPQKSKVKSIFLASFAAFQNSNFLQYDFASLMLAWIPRASSSSNVWLRLIFILAQSSDLRSQPCLDAVPICSAWPSAIAKFRWSQTSYAWAYLYQTALWQNVISKM